MNEEQANAIAGALGGETWQSGGNIWLVLFRRADGRLTVISEDVVCEYATWDDFDGGRAASMIPIA